MTYTVEAGSLLRTVFALLLCPDGSVSEQADFLSIANDPVPPNGLWQSMFAAWAPEAIAAAGLRAAAVSERIGAAGVAGDIRAGSIAMPPLLRAWLVGRANELCGRATPIDERPVCFRTQRKATGGAMRHRNNGWPEFATDPSVSAPQRREAAEALARSSARATTHSRDRTMRLWAC